MNAKVSLTIAVIFVGSFGMYLFATIGPLGQYLAKKNAIVDVESPWERDLVADHDTQAREGQWEAYGEPDEALRAVQAQREEVANERRHREAQRRLRAAISRSEQILEEERAQQEGERTATTAANFIETVRNGDEMIFETLTRRMVQESIRVQRDAVDRCAREANPEEYRGFTQVRFVVEEDGSVSEATVTGGLEEPELSECVSEAVKNFRFPKTLDTRHVTYPFQIQ